MTSLFENPFYLLGISIHDTRQRILDLSQKNIPLEHIAKFSQNKSELLHPRKRLQHEIAWLPGLYPPRALSILNMLNNNELIEHCASKCRSEFGYTNFVGSISNDPDKNEKIDLANINLLLNDYNAQFPGKERHIDYAGRSLAEANIQASILTRLPLQEIDLIAKLIGKLAITNEFVEIEAVFFLINSDRKKSGFPATDLPSIKDELIKRRMYFQILIINFLDQIYEFDSSAITYRYVIKLAINEAIRCKSNYADILGEILPDYPYLLEKIIQHYDDRFGNDIHKYFKLIAFKSLISLDDVKKLIHYFEYAQPFIIKYYLLNNIHEDSNNLLYNLKQSLKIVSTKLDNEIDAHIYNPKYQYKKPACPTANQLSLITKTIPDLKNDYDFFMSYLFRLHKAIQQYINTEAYPVFNCQAINDITNVPVKWLTQHLGSNIPTEDFFYRVEPFTIHEIDAVYLLNNYSTFNFESSDHQQSKVNLELLLKNAFPLLKLREGYTLDYVYHTDGISSEPYLYSRRTNERSLIDYHEFCIKFGLVKERMPLGHEPTLENSYPIIRGLNFNLAPNSILQHFLFQLAMFLMKGHRFHLRDHSWYNNRFFLLSKNRLKKLCEKNPDGEFTQKELELLLELDPRPKIYSKNNFSMVSLLNYEMNSGVTLLNLIFNGNFFIGLCEKTIIKNKSETFY